MSEAAREDVDVLIVGAGPAGTSAALHLAARGPSWVGRVMVVDRAVFPREKLCGGAVTHLGEKILTRMGLGFVPEHVAVREVRVVHGSRRCSFRGNPVLRITRREVFDHWLLREVASRGILVRQGEGVRAIDRRPDGVVVTTDRGEIRARVVIAADGSRSTVRRLLGMRDHAHVARLLEVLTPDARGAPAFEDGVAVFEFGSVGRGLAGYYWDFPSYKDGAFVMNRGVFDPRNAGDEGGAASPLRAALGASLSRRGVDLASLELKGHPLRTFNPAGPLATDRILFCGDSAGADPLLGEGISFALAYGEVAADAVIAAFSARRFDFADYGKRVRRHPLLGQLPARVRLSKLLARASSPLAHDVLWMLGERLVARSRWRDEAYVPAADDHWILRA